MPTLHKRTTKPGYCVLTRTHGNNVTYQISDRALEFYKNLGYSDGSKLDWEFVWPLRELGDLYTKGEGSPETESNNPVSIGDSYSPDASDDELQALAQYVFNHPKYTVDLQDEFSEGMLGENIDNLDSKIKSDSTVESGSIDSAVQMDEKDSLDRIVTEYFGHGQNDEDISPDDSNPDDDTETDDLSADVAYRIERWTNKEQKNWNLKSHQSELASLSGLESSVRDFADHPWSVTSFSLRDGPVYVFTINQDGHYIWCSDNRFNQQENDFTVSELLDTQLVEESYNEVSLFADIKDGHISSWHFESDEYSLYLDEIHPAECHGFVYEQANFFELVVDFFERFPEYDLIDP